MSLSTKISFKFLIHNIQTHSLFARAIYLMCAAICFGSLMIAIYYLQDVLWLEPCPYCKLQRVIFFMMGTVFLILAIVNPKRIFAIIGIIIQLIVLGLGVFVAGKHIYTQNNASPEASANCQATNSSIAEVLDFEVVHQILSAKGDCGIIDWTFLGLSIPMLSMIAYIGLSVISLFVSCCYIKVK